MSDDAYAFSRVDQFSFSISTNLFEWYVDFFLIKVSNRTLFYSEHWTSISFPFMEHFKQYVNSCGLSIEQSWDMIRVYDRSFEWQWFFS